MNSRAWSSLQDTHTRSMHLPSRTAVNAYAYAPEHRSTVDNTTLVHSNQIINNTYGHAAHYNNLLTPMSSNSGLDTDTCILRVWFYTPSSGDPWINKLVVRYDPPFSHTELQFHDGQALTMYMGSRVRMKTRTFNPESYTCVHVPVSLARYKRMYYLAEKLKENPLIVFSKYEAFLALNGMQPSQAYSPEVFEYIEHGAFGNASNEDQPAVMQSFCARLIGDLMAYVGILPKSVTSTSMTPSGLAKCLQEIQAAPLSGTTTLNLQDSAFDMSPPTNPQPSHVHTRGLDSTPVFHTDVRLHTTLHPYKHA